MKNRKQNFIRIGLVILITGILSFVLKERIINQYFRILYNIELAKAPKIKLNISSEEQKKLLNDRDSIYNLISEDNSTWPKTNSKKPEYKGSLILKNSLIDCNIKIGGHYKDHLNSPTSLKITSQKNISIQNTQTNKFNLLNPLTRHLYLDIIANTILKKKGFQTIVTNPVNVNINGKKEVYLFEENYKSSRLNNNNGFVFKSDLNDGILKLNPVIKNNTNKNILKKITEKGVINFIDFEKFNFYIFLAEVFNSSHQMLTVNQRYYYDKRTNKIHPIGREFFLKKYNFKNKLISSNIIYDKILQKKIDPLLVLFITSDKFSNTPS